VWEFLIGHTGAEQDFLENATEYRKYSATFTASPVAE
jgi:hypothetical protein